MEEPSARCVKLTNWKVHFCICRNFPLFSPLQNCSYIQNPGFPAASTTTNAISFTVTKCAAGKNIVLRQVFIQCWKTRVGNPIFFCRCLPVVPGLWDLQHCGHERERKRQRRGLRRHVFRHCERRLIFFKTKEVFQRFKPAEKKTRLFFQSTTGKFTPTICGLNSGQHSKTLFFLLLSIWLFQTWLTNLSTYWTLNLQCTLTLEPTLATPQPWALGLTRPTPPSACGTSRSRSWSAATKEGERTH